MDEYITLTIIFGLITVLMLIILYFVNNLILRRTKVDFQFESIVKYLSDRVALLDRIASFVEGNTENEEKYIDMLNEASINLDKVENSNQDNIKEIKNATKLFQKFKELQKIYPNILKNQIYSNIIQEIDLNEQRIMYAIDTYDKEAKKYNEMKQKKVNATLCKIFKIKDYEYYNK